MSQEDRLQFVKDKINETQIIVKKLSKIAEKDSIITEEEQSILKSVEDNVDHLQNVLHAAVKNSDISDDEMALIHILEKKIFQDAGSKAIEDGVISKDEKAILHELIDIFSVDED